MFPLRAHRCWRTGTPEPIPSPYQAAICLAAGHPGCPRYRDAAAPPPWQPRPWWRRLLRHREASP